MTLYHHLRAKGLKTWDWNLPLILSAPVLAQSSSLWQGLSDCYEGDLTCTNRFFFHAFPRSVELLMRSCRHCIPMPLQTSILWMTSTILEAKMPTTRLPFILTNLELRMKSPWNLEISLVWLEIIGMAILKVSTENWEGRACIPPTKFERRQKRSSTPHTLRLRNKAQMDQKDHQTQFKPFEPNSR